MTIRERWLWLLAHARVYRRLVLIELSLEESTVGRSPGGVEVRLLGSADAEAYAALRPGATAEEVRARLARGEWCSAGWRDGRVVSAIWATTGRAHIPYLDRDLDLARGEAYCYDSFTAPAHRGHEIATLRSNLLRRTLREAGVRRLLAVIRPETPAVRRRSARRLAVGHERPLGLIGYVGFGPWRRYFFRPERPR